MSSSMFLKGVQFYCLISFLFKFMQLFFIVLSVDEIYLLR